MEEQNAEILGRLAFVRKKERQKIIKAAHFVFLITALIALYFKTLL